MNPLFKRMMMIPFHQKPTRYLAPASSCYEQFVKRATFTTSTISTSPMETSLSYPYCSVLKSQPHSQSSLQLKVQWQGIATTATGTPGSTNLQSKEKKPRKPKKEPNSNHPLNTVEYKVTKELESVLGKSVTTRADALKGIWNYIKAQNLKDEAAKDYVSDSKLKNMGMSPRFKSTDVMKVLSQNIGERVTPIPEKAPKTL